MPDRAEYDFLDYAGMTAAAASPKSFGDYNQITDANGAGKPFGGDNSNDMTPEQGQTLGGGVEAGNHIGIVTVHNPGKDNTIAGRMGVTPREPRPKQPGPHTPNDFVGNRLATPKEAQDNYEAGLEQTKSDDADRIAQYGVKPSLPMAVPPKH